MTTKNSKFDFEVGDIVVSAPDSSDIKLMKMVWVAEVIEIIQENDHGGCYETLGRWDHEPDTQPDTLRQLWGSHLMAVEVAE